MTEDQPAMAIGSKNADRKFPILTVEDLIHDWNLSNAESEMLCPKCHKRGTAYHDPEVSDHPGTFECRECGAMFYA